MAWTTIRFNSETLNMPVMLDVLIPQGHGNYKQLYLLHGAGGDHSSWITKSRVADYVEKKNIAVIMPSGNNKCYVNNVNGNNYFDYITDELIKKCETWFSLSDKKDDRFIAGMSMGGYGAVYAALNKPELYKSVFSYSGLLDIKQRFKRPQGLDLYPVFGNEEQFSTGNYDLYEIIHKIGEKDALNVENYPEFFIQCGNQDKRLDMSKEFAEEMKKYNFNIFYEEKYGDHNWDYWDECIKETLNYINGL